ncbi:HD domain-containing protein [Vibrio viridaestus]|uniref:HD domain-containing protein n=1 Tax=Vibrio viridaestus TaxID=2487322 RepID=A0A3N9TZ56_9VIBR|nr:HD domain-containing protein [Vibrio viridaestus]RQW62242.1 HD domain-containing protein [Vibrio viridaestus]
MLTTAREFAIKHHGDQRYGEKPYSYHLEQVVELLQPYGKEAQIIGYLHDVVEDTPATVEMIESLFDTKIAQAVSILTDEPGETRQERKAKTYHIMSTVQGELEIALLVKAADRLANVRSCVENGRDDKFMMYREEQPQFEWAAYRPGLCDEFWEELRALLDSED